MKSIISYSTICPKYSPEQEEKLKQKIMTIANQIDQIDNKHPDFRDHCKCFREVMQTVFWVFVVRIGSCSLPPSSSSREPSNPLTSGP